MIMWKRVSKLLSALCLFPLTMMATERDLHLAEISHVDDVSSAFTVAGAEKIELREVLTETQGKNGKMRTLGVIVLYDPASGAFSWRVFEADRRDPSFGLSYFKDSSETVYLFDGVFVDFTALPMPNRLFIREYRGHASSLDQAEELALKAASTTIDPLGDLERGQGVHKVSLPELGRDFTDDPMSTSEAPTPIALYPKVINVRRDADHWIVTLQSRWKEAITLDANYNLVSMKKLE